MRPVQRLIIGLAILLGATGCQTMIDEESLKTREQQVRDTEIAFAQTMADRDLEAFGSFLAEETVFFAGEDPLVGKDAVVSAWAPFFEKPDAPFSWTPQTVVVLASGELALSTGPVYNPAGEKVGTYNSIWRREGTGVWKIVFDKGS